MHRLYLNYYNNNNNNAPPNNNIINLQHLQKQQLSQQQQNIKSLKINIDQQKIFIPDSSSSSSSCSTFSSSSSSSSSDSPIRPCMSPPILNNEIDNNFERQQQQHWDDEMPELEPQIVQTQGDHDYAVDNVFIPTKKVNETLQFNNTNNNIPLNINSSKLNLSSSSSTSSSSSSSTCSTTSSGVWSSTADSFLILARKQPKIEIEEKIENKKEEEKTKTLNIKIPNILNHKKKISNLKQKTLQIKKEIQEVEEIIQKKRGRRKKVDDEQNIKVKEECLDEHVFEKENKLGRRNKLNVEMKKSFRMRKTKQVGKVEENDELKVLKVGKRKRNCLLDVFETEQKKKNKLNKDKKSMFGKKLRKGKEVKNTKNTKTQTLIVRRRKRKALLLAKSKLSRLANKKEDKSKVCETTKRRRLNIPKHMTPFSTSSSPSPPPKLTSKPLKSALSISKICSEPLQFISNWRPIDQGYIKRLPLRRHPETNYENNELHLCFNSIRHVSETEICIQLGDNVMVQSDDEEDSFVGRVLAIHYDSNEQSLFLTVLWFYTEKQLPSSMRSNDSTSTIDENELFASRHLDIINADSVQGIVRVLTFSSYCRYRAQLALECLPEERRPPEWTRPCPRFENNSEQIDVSDDDETNDKTVFFCRSIFSIHSKRRVRSKFLQLDKNSNIVVDSKKSNGLNNITKNLLRSSRR